jgi:hypothetical protein
MVQAVSKVDTVEYTTPEVVTTDAMGKFQLARVFPGKSLIRVTTSDGTVTDVPVAPGWARATDEVVDLDKLMLGPGQLGPQCMILAACCPNLPTEAVRAQCEAIVAQADEINCQVGGGSLLRLCR